eukprot:739866-Alexandrium_andersonii.AAC.1
MPGNAERGWRRIAARVGLVRIADRTLGTLPCKDPRPYGIASGGRSLNRAAPGTVSTVASLASRRVAFCTGVRADSNIWQRTGPVSYTHLRAHETSAHL